MSSVLSRSSSPPPTAGVSGDGERSVMGGSTGGGSTGGGSTGEGREGGGRAGTLGKLGNVEMSESIEGVSWGSGSLWLGTAGMGGRVSIGWG